MDTEKCGKPAYCTIAWTGGRYTVTYYRERYTSNHALEGYDISVFRDVPDETPLMDFRKCPDENLIVSFICNNDTPDCISYDGPNENLDVYLRRYADYCKINVSTIGKLRQSSTEL